MFTEEIHISHKRSHMMLFMLFALLLMNIPVHADSDVASPRMPYATVPDPLLSNPDTILQQKITAWRQSEFEVFRCKSLSKILIFDTDTYKTQSAFFKRLAFFTEKNGYTGRISSAAAFSDKKGYNAHNYHARDLARYFNKISASMLLPEELLLRDILLISGVLIYKHRSYYGKEGGVISISRSSSPSLRKLLLVHELSHAVFYTVADYREGVQQLWMELSPAEQLFWSLFLYGRGYSVKDINLVVNEYHAYLLQQPRSEVNSYFRRQIGDLRVRFPSYEPFLRNFVKSYGQRFSVAASRLETLLQAPLSPGGVSFYDIRRQIFSSP